MESVADLTTLVLRVQEGDRDAFRALVETFQARVRFQIACSGVPGADVDDIAQDVFVWLYENIRSFQPGTEFGAWCAAVARNKVRAHLELKRRETRNREKALEELATRLSCSVAAVKMSLMRARAQLRACVERRS